MDLNLARTLIKIGRDLMEVRERAGITNAVYYQIKRQVKPKKVIFGCVVCCGPKHAMNFCIAHYFQYIRKPREHRRLKSA